MHFSHIIRKLSIVCLTLSRMLKSGTGAEEFEFPDPTHLLLHRDILLNYLTNLDTIQGELARELYNIAKDNTVIVVTVNKGQSELLVNFVCSARSRGLDISNLIVFPTDLYSKALAESMGLTTFYSDEVNCALARWLFDCKTLTFLMFIVSQLMKSIPSYEAQQYGDRDFAVISETMMPFLSLLD